MTFTPTRIGRCQVCDRSGRLNARICHVCQDHYGRRVAELLAMAREDTAFAESCARALEGEARESFIAALQGQDVPERSQSRGSRPRPGLRKCAEGEASHLRLVSSPDSRSTG